MRRTCVALVACALLGLCFPVSGAAVTITAFPEEPQIGDIITINGTVSGVSTIAVFLFVTGPGLDPRGTPLDNLNVPTGRGLFTTAPVFMENGTWTYTWDTSVILGSLQPGNYTIHAVTVPVDDFHIAHGDHAEKTVRFQPQKVPVTESPASPVLSVSALGITIASICFLGRTPRR